MASTAERIDASSASGPCSSLHGWFGCGLELAPEHPVLRIGSRERNFRELHETALHRVGTGFVRDQGPTDRFSVPSGVGR